MTEPLRGQSARSRDLIAFVEQMDRCWLERRFGDLASFLASDVVIVPPGAAQRVEGVGAAINSYREFMTPDVFVRRFETSDHVVTDRGPTAVVEYKWSMAWGDRKSTYEADGGEVLVLNNSDEGWRVIWRMQVPR